MRFALVAGCVLLLTISCQANKYSKRQGIPDLVAVAGEDCTQFCDLACNNQCFEGDDCFKEDCECGCDTFCVGKPEAPKKILHFSFNEIDKAAVTKVQDASDFGNDGKLSFGTKIMKGAGAPCGNFAALFDSTICVHGPSIQSKPKHGITIMLWAQAHNIKGAHSFFSVYPSTMGLIATQNKGLYHLELNDNQVRFMHRGKSGAIMFSTHAKAIKKDKWSHIAATYDSKRTQAKVYIDGELANFTSAEGGCLNTDWNDVCVGGNKDFRPLHGEVDEFKIFNYALDENKIKSEMNSCKGAVGAITNTSVKKPSRGSDSEDKESKKKDDDFIELDNATV